MPSPAGIARPARRAPRAASCAPRSAPIVPRAVRYTRYAPRPHARPHAAPVRRVLPQEKERKEREAAEAAAAAKAEQAERVARLTASLGASLANHKPTRVQALAVEAAISVDETAALRAFSEYEDPVQQAAQQLAAKMPALIRRGAPRSE